MAEARGREAWNHTAALLAMLANCHRDPKRGRPFRAKEFHPHETGAPAAVHVTSENVGLLRQAFGKETDDATIHTDPYRGGLDAGAGGDGGGGGVREEEPEPDA